MQNNEFSLEEPSTYWYRWVENLFAAALRERHPDYRLVPGTALYNLLIRPAASAHAGVFSLLDTYVKGRSIYDLQLAISRGEDIPDRVVDAIASNFSVKRREAEKARGTIEVFVSRDINMSITRDSVSFSSPGGLSFNLLRDIYVKATGATGVPEGEIDENTRVTQLIDRGDGTFSFFVYVSATSPGFTGGIISGSGMQLSGSIANFVRAVAHGNFEEGRDIESNESMLERLFRGTAPEVVSNTGSFGRIMDMGDIPYLDYAVCGAHSSVMLRDEVDCGDGVQKTGGLVDLYVRTASHVSEVTVSEDVYEVEENTHTVNFDLSNRDRFFDIAGFYRINRVVAYLVNADGEDIPTAIPVQVDNVTYGTAPRYEITVPPGEVTPVYAADAPIHTAFSVYRTCEVDVSFPDGVDLSPEGISHVRLEFSFLKLPGILSAQKLFSRKNVAPAAGDVMVKAPVPIITTCAVTIDCEPGVDTEDPEFRRILDFGVCNAVNSVPMGTKMLSAAVLMSAITTALAGRGIIADYPNLLGNVTLPSGQAFTLPRDIVLHVPNYIGVSPGNTAFFMEPGYFDESSGKYCTKNFYNFRTI